MFFDRLLSFLAGSEDAGPAAAFRDELTDPSTTAYGLFQGLALASKQALSRDVLDAVMVYPEEAASMSLTARAGVRRELIAELRALAPASLVDRLSKTEELVRRAAPPVLPVYDDAFAELIRTRAIVLAQAERSPEALALLNQVIGEFRQRVGIMNLSFGVILHEYGRLLYRDGRGRVAVDALREAADVLLVVVGEYARQTLTAVENLARAEHAVHDLAAARKNYEAICVWLDDLPSADIMRDRIPWARLGLATVLFDLAELENAREAVRRALSGFRSTSTTERRGAAEALSLLGRIAEEVGDGRLAERRYRTSLRLMRPADREQLTDAAWTHLLLGRLLLRGGRHFESWPHLQAARGIYDRAGAGDKPVYSALENEVARYWLTEDRPNDALVSAISALRIAQAYYEGFVPAVVPYLNNLSVVLLRVGRLTEAKGYLADALHIADRTPDADRLRAGVANNLALVAEAEDDLVSAQQYFESALASAMSDVRVAVDDRASIAGNLLRILGRIGSASARQRFDQIRSAGPFTTRPATPIFLKAA